MGATEDAEARLAGYAEQLGLDPSVLALAKGQTSDVVISRGLRQVWRFPRTEAGVSRLGLAAERTRAARALGLSRQIFFCSMGGFDTHGGQLAAQDALLQELSENLGLAVVMVTHKGDHTMMSDPGATRSGLNVSHASTSLTAAVTTIFGTTSPSGSAPRGLTGEDADRVQEGECGRRSERRQGITIRPRLGAGSTRSHGRSGSLRTGPACRSWCSPSAGRAPDRRAHPRSRSGGPAG